MSKKIALLVGSFHTEEMKIMTKKANEVASELELEVVNEMWVPGSMEKPIALKKLLGDKDIDGVAILGIIERGETKHGLVMAQTVVAKILDLQLEYNKPVGMGILGPEIDPEQIPPRLEPYAEKAVRALDTMLEVLD